MTDHVIADPSNATSVATPFPVRVTVEPDTGRRNRLTTALRPILAIPHTILVGPAVWVHRSGGVGVLGAAAYVMAIVSWFTLLVNGQHFTGIREFALYYLRWRTRALAYMGLFTDSYPPFGDGTYPASIAVADPAGTRDKSTIAVRLLLALPHILLVCVLVVGWFVTTLIAWCAILVTGSYPQGLLPFGIGVMRWELRVEAYLLLLVDEYPPFSLD